MSSLHVPQNKYIMFRRDGYLEPIYDVHDVMKFLKDFFNEQINSAPMSNDSDENDEMDGEKNDAEVTRYHFELSYRLAIFRLWIRTCGIHEIKSVY